LEGLGKKGKKGKGKRNEPLNSITGRGEKGKGRKRQRFSLFLGEEQREEGEGEVLLHSTFSGKRRTRGGKRDSKKEGGRLREGRKGEETYINFRMKGIQRLLEEGGGGRGKTQLFLWGKKRGGRDLSFQTEQRFREDTEVGGEKRGRERGHQFELHFISMIKGRKKGGGKEGGKKPLPTFHLYVGEG